MRCWWPSRQDHGPYVVAARHPPALDVVRPVLGPQVGDRVGLAGVDQRSVRRDEPDDRELVLQALDPLLEPVQPVLVAHEAPPGISRCITWCIAQHRVGSGPLVLLDGPADRPVGEVRQPVAGDVLRVGRLEAGDVEAAVRPAPSPGVRVTTEDQLEHVDTAVAELDPQALGEDLAERLHPAVHRVPDRAHRAGLASRAARSRRGRGRASGGRSGWTSARGVVMLRSMTFWNSTEVAVEELLAVGVGAGVVDEQADLDVLDRVDDLRDRLRRASGRPTAVRTSTPRSRQSAAVSSSGSGLRAISTRLNPASASWVAKARPTPSEPPAITAHGPYLSTSVMPRTLGPGVRHFES